MVVGNLIIIFFSGFCVNVGFKFVCFENKGICFFEFFDFLIKFCRGGIMIVYYFLV